jgi:hypothetical protein
MHRAASPSPLLTVLSRSALSAADVAERWLELEQLPPSYREQIVAFIIQNTARHRYLSSLHARITAPAHISPPAHLLACVLRC